MPGFGLRELGSARQSLKRLTFRVPDIYSGLGLELSNDYKSKILAIPETLSLDLKT